MGGWLSSWMVTPAMMWLGLLAVSIPIIIHLLNKRRFKIVDWAAMDFLFEADKKNRRRVRLENLLLLLLRCLAMGLIGLLLARPFFPSQLSSMLFNTQQFERIVLLDDSLSMQVQLGNENAFDRAKTSLTQLARTLAENDTTDSLTVIVTSNPDRAAMTSGEVNGESLDDVIDQINELEVSDKTANFETALRETNQYLKSEKKNVNRVVYLVSDFREQDWKTTTGKESENSPNALVKSLSGNVAGTFLVDVGDDYESNLSIKEIKPRETLIASVPATFDVTVSNHGSSDVHGVKLKFLCGDQLPLEETVDVIPANTEKTVQFSFLFTPSESDLDQDADLEERLRNNRVSYRIEAQIVDISDGIDHLLTDSVSYYAARVLHGIPTLLVDGDPSSDVRRSETTFLRRALAPPGDLESGNLVDVVTFTEFETTSLSKYNVIFLCNIDEVSQDRLASLSQWVERGGGLVIMPGDRTIAETFNDQFFLEGGGLSPLGLGELGGDINQQTWANLEVAEQNHEITGIFAGPNNPILAEIKIFNWWRTFVKEEQVGSSVNLVARLNDPDNSVALAEKNFGKGRVISFAVPADFDWSNWPENVSFVPFFLILNDYVAGDLTGVSAFQVGFPLSLPIDLARYDRNATVHTPDEEKSNVQATPIDSEDAARQALWQFSYPESSRKGFYELTLTGTSGHPETFLYAANIDPREGRLARLDMDASGRNFFGEKAKMISSDVVGSESVQGSRDEVWIWLLLILGGILGAEQLLGWFFGRRR